MTKKERLQQELEELNKKESREDCIKRLLAEIANAGTNATTIDLLEFRQDQYGLRDCDMAKILGISKGHYSEILSGKRELPKKAMIRAIIIGIPPLAFAEYLRAATLVK